MRVLRVVLDCASTAALTAAAGVARGAALLPRLSSLDAHLFFCDGTGGDLSREII